MDNIVFNAVMQYYKMLGKVGYYQYKDVFRLLVLCFYKDFVFTDFRGNITRKDYHQIELALNCLFGSSCLIPYPQYLKMGKLHIGEITEMAQRVKNLEDTKVLKLMNPETSSDSDIIISVEEEEET